MKEFPANTLVDNIEVDPSTGDLWIGCHPVAYRIFDDINQFFGLSLPSQVPSFVLQCFVTILYAAEVILSVCVRPCIICFVFNFIEEGNRNLIYRHLNLSKR